MTRYWTELRPGTVLRGQWGDRYMLAVVIDPRGYTHPDPKVVKQGACYVFWPSWSGNRWQAHMTFDESSDRHIDLEHWQILEEPQ